MTDDASGPARSLKRRRTSSSTASSSTKAQLQQQQKRNHHHELHNLQALPPHTELAPQDATFTQSQLLRSICAALTIAGYDSVKPSALESFRAMVEEYMLRFLADARTSMHSARRTSLLPSDMTFALTRAHHSCPAPGAALLADHKAAHALTSSDLEPHLALSLPVALSAPSVAAPAPPEAPPPDLSSMLGPDLLTPAISTQEVATTSYIPPHFPALPSRHSYMSTQTFTERQGNARAIREKATEEGILAEKALRRLTAASRAQEMKRIKERDSKRVATSRGNRWIMLRERREGSWRDVLGELMDDDDGDEDDDGLLDKDKDELGFDVATESNNKKKASHQDDGDGDGANSIEALLRSGGVNVDHDRGHWRRGAGPGAGAVVR